MKTKMLLFPRNALLGISLLCTSTVLAQNFVGQWDFNNGTLAGTSGGDLSYSGGAQAGTQFGSTTTLGIPDIGGSPAQVMKFPANINSDGYYIPTPPNANGGGSTVNEWTAVMDVLYPSASATVQRPLLDVDGSYFSANPEFVVSSTGALGVGGGASFGTLSPDTWYRLGIVVTATSVRFYVDGALVGQASGAGLDNRFALTPGWTALLFGTGGTEAGAGYVNSIQLRDVALSDGQMRALGGPSAAGIPTTIPPVPSYVQTWIPSGSVAPRTTAIGAIINKGESTINSITLKLDGVAVTDAQQTDQGTTVLIVKSNTAPLAVNSSHTVEVSYTDSAAGQKTLTHQFTAVLLYEDFEELVLGTTLEESAGTPNVWTPTPPVGWVTNHTGMPGYGDLANDGMTEWAGWTFAKKDFWVTAAGDQTRSQFTRGQGTIAIADPDEWDDNTHASGSFNSFLSTPAIDVTGLPENTVYIKFDSSWRPEAPQVATLTVSYDGGAAVEVLRWEASGANYHPDSQNEGVQLQLNNPASAKSMVVTFGLTQAGNNWWWAFDNLEINSAVIKPVISGQPQNQNTSPGADAIFHVQASGTEPLSYQWLFKGQPLSGETTSTLVVSNVTTNDAGAYQVTVSNAAGSDTSREAMLTVFTGTIAQDLVVHLKFDNSFDDSSGRNNNALAMSNPTFETSPLGQAIHVDQFNYVSLGYPEDLKLGSADTAVNFSIAFWSKINTTSGDPSFIGNKNWNAGGNPGLVIDSEGGGSKWNYRDDQSDRRDSPVVGTTLNDTTWHHVAVTFERTGLATIYIDGQFVDGTSIAPDPGKAVGSVDTDQLGLAWNVGQDGTGTYGSNLDGLVDDLGFWRRSLTPQEVLAIYTAGLNSKDLSQAVVAPGKVKPSILQQPEPATVEQGLTATFMVKASGTDPLTYLWYRGTTPVPGGTAATLTLRNVQPSDAGDYTVAITNAAGGIVSTPATLTVTPAKPVIVTGQWDFNSGDLKATVGNDLTSSDAIVEGDTQFGSTTSFGIADIAGAPAQVMYYVPSGGKWSGYVMAHGAEPNGGGSYVNRFTIIYDLYYPTTSDRTWRCLLQSNTSNSNDGDFFINGSNGIGISGNYSGTVAPETWNRIVAVFDMTGPTLKKYINGTLVGSQTLDALDGRWSLDPTALLFADEDGETNPGYVNSIQFRNGVMTDAEVAALGGVTTDGIPIPVVKPTIGSITLSGTSITITWQGSPEIKLQQNTALGATGWTDVPDSLGKSSMTLPATGAAGFFRLSN